MRFCLVPPAVCLSLALDLTSASYALAQPPAGSFELPVTGGDATIARLGIRPEECGIALHLLARAMHGVVTADAGGGLAATAAEILGSTATEPARAGGPGAVVLAPFSDAVWRRVLGLSPGADLFRAIVMHRGALLVSAGAMQSRSGFREWLAREPRLLQDVVTRWAGSFAQAAPALQVTGDRVAVPGGAPLDAAWGRLVGVPSSNPDEFLRRLLARDDGHLARFYGTLGRLDDVTRAALLRPLPGEDAPRALAATYRLARAADAPWDPNAHPYQLSHADLPSVLHALGPPPAGAMLDVASRWPALLSGGVRSRADARALLAAAPGPEPYVALVRAMLDGSPDERRDRMTVVAMARRAWDAAAPADAQADLLHALGQYRRVPALLLTLDRLAVTSPEAWAGLVDAAARVDAGNGRARRLRLAVFQGALALVERARIAGSLEPDTTDRVLLSLAAAVDGATAPAASVRAWLLDSFIPALPPLVRPDRFSGPTAYESRVLQALAGRPLEAPPTLSWEGADYTVDVVAAEHERIRRIRSLLPSPGLDTALAGQDDEALAAALAALAYAPALGDPEGAVSLGPEVVERHDFGGSRSSPGRDVPWRVPVERTGIGEPWHVAGSLLGLDVALARSALRRLSIDDLPAMPTVNLNDQLTLARTAVALRPAGLDDATRDELANAIGRGRARVAAAGARSAALLALADEAALPLADREALAWSVSRIPDAGPSLFSMRDLLWLGRPRVDGATLDRWGVLSHPVDGRLATRFDAPLPWVHLAGRPNMGVLATQVPDLTLRLVEVTAERRLPAALIPALLLFATQDFWHEVEARFSDDWPAMVRGAAGLSVARIEDYVAALASAGPLRPR